MEQLCEDIRRFAIQIRQIGFSVNGGVGERECLDLSDRMLAAVQRAESRNAEPEMGQLNSKVPRHREP